MNISELKNFEAALGQELDFYRPMFLKAEENLRESKKFLSSIDKVAARAEFDRASAFYFTVLNEKMRNQNEIFEMTNEGFKGKA